jgi:prevent-host-death family protein
MTNLRFRQNSENRDNFKCWFVDRDTPAAGFIGETLMPNSRSADSNTWTLTRAKAHFSRLIERAQTSPQIITRRGEPRAVMVGAKEWARKTERKGTLAEFLLASPLRDAPMDIQRIRDRPADFDL